MASTYTKGHSKLKTSIELRFLICNQVSISPNETNYKDS